MGEHSELHFAFPFDFLFCVYTKHRYPKKKTKKNHTTISRFDCLRQWCETRDVKLESSADLTSTHAARKGSATLPFWRSYKGCNTQTIFRNFNFLEYKLIFTDDFTAIETQHMEFVARNSFVPKRVP